MGMGLGGCCLGVQSARDWWICEMRCFRFGMGDGGFLCSKWYGFLFFPVCQNFFFNGSTTNHGGLSFGGVGFMS
jgi:hypothetical protein